MKHLLFVLLGIASSAFAEHIYIAQTTQGSDTGANAANAHSVVWFNTAGNWDTDVSDDGKIGPGDTVHLTGTISSQIIFQRPGTVGNRITLKFDPGSIMSAPHWTGTGAIYMPGSTFANITIEGKHSTPVKTALIEKDMEATSEGTGLPGHVEARFIFADSGGANCTIKNLWLYGLYIRTYAHPSDIGASGSAISVRGRDDIIVENVAVQHAETGVTVNGVGPAGTTNNRLIIRDCYITDCSNGIKMGSTGITKDGQIIRNRIDHMARWSGIESGGFHADGIQTITIGAGPDTTRNENLTVAYNHIGPNTGPGSAMTACIFLEDYINGCKIYNNIIETGWGYYGSNSLITVGTHDEMFGKPYFLRSIVSNNTVVHHDGDTTLGSPDLGKGIEVRNAIVTGNIVYKTHLYESIAGFAAANRANYNIFFGTTDGSPFGIPDGDGGAGPGVYSIGNWINLTSYDDNSLPPFVTNPQLVSTAHNAVDFRLQSSSPARNFLPTVIDGVDLSAIYTDDYNGTPRGVGPWDAGAFEFAAGGPSAPIITATSINAAGTQFSITFSENVQFGTGGTGGMSVTSNAGAVTLGTQSIAGATITWPITNRLIGSGETLTRTYTQPGNGIESVSTGTDVPSFAGLSVTNSSTVATAATPQFAPIPGAYSSTQNVTMTSSTPGAIIRYTTDGTDPTASSTQYTAPIPTSLSTTYRAQAFATGFLNSPVAVGAYNIGDFVIGGIWTNIGVANQTGTFTWTFRATSSTSPNDAVLGLTNKTVAAYADLGVIARFAASGRIDAWNDGPVTKDYAAVNPFPYVAGQAYDFVVTVNIPTHTYSMTVVQAGGSSPTVIATNYGFRGVQATATNLNNFGAISTGGSVTVSNMLFSTAAPTLSLTGIATNTAGTQITATFNSQPSFGTGGQGGFTVSASGGATTPSAPTVGTNSITWNLSRTIGRGETISATYVQPGNGIEAASGGSDLASFAGQSAANNSTVDTTAPTPNPSTFGISPTALTSSTITMTATTSTDAATPPVQYFFNEVSGNAGGSDSGWQSSSTFTDAGLAAGTQYRYRVQARDSAVPPNVTTFSQEFSATTKSVAGARPAQPFNMVRANIVTP